MAQISIRKYQDSDFKEVISILVSSFEKKVCHRQNLTRNDLEKKCFDKRWKDNYEKKSF